MKKIHAVILTAGIIVTACIIFIPEKEEKPEPIARVSAGTSAERIVRENRQKYSSGDFLGDGFCGSTENHF